ncbi:MAG: ABC transporter ATP-binding protein [Planctomycetota bacterium]|nr:MAG: ABC transporter ATP-binding protein [Planctomycetota bacterium]
MSAATETAAPPAAGTKTDAVIDVENVTHLFKAHRALDGVSFRVSPHSLHGFVGPNGAGKTTSLKLICTLLKPQTGRIRVFGHDVRDEVKAIRRRIGYMPDHFSMYRQMTVFEYLDFFGAAYGFSLKERNRIVADVLALTDMDGRKDDLIQGLSRGMQQRVSLARVLVNDPDLLPLDEPASGLDPRARIELMEILRELKRMGKTIFISSHILSELAELCDSVTIIDRGKTKYSGPMEHLLHREAEHPTYRLRLDVPIDGFDQTLAAMPGVIEVVPAEGKPEYRVSIDATATDHSALLRNVLDAGASIMVFQKDQRHLNEAFMDLTERGVRQ